MKRRRRMSPRVAGPRSPLASGRARADTVDRSRPRGISLLSLGRTEARMAEAARPERAALPSFSTFSTMAGLAAEALTDSLSHRGGEGKVVVSSRSGYPMRVMVGVVVHPWHPDTTNAKPISLGDARERPRRARLRAQKTSGDSACASPRSRARSTSHRASRDEPEPRANPVGAIKTPHRSAERIAKTKIPRWGLPPVLTACWCGPRRRARRRWWRRCKPSFLLELRKVVRCVCKYDADGGATIGVCPSPASPTKLCQLTGEYASTNQKARRADFHGSVLNLCILPDFRRARWHVDSKNPYEAHRLDKIWTRAHAQHRLAQRLAPALDGAARQTAGTRVRPEDGAATDRSGTQCTRACRT